MCNSIIVVTVQTEEFSELH